MKEEIVPSQKNIKFEQNNIDIQVHETDMTSLETHAAPMHLNIPPTD
jgi:hypothetical protein